MIKMSYSDWSHGPELLIGFWQFRKSALFGIFYANTNIINFRTFETLVHVFWRAKKYEFNKFGSICVQSEIL